MANSALTAIWRRLFQGHWQRRLLPGATVIGLVVLARLLGVFQEAEWKALDIFLRWRPDEPQDERILIVGVDEADLQRLETYPIPDDILADLLQTLAQYEPRVIGIDILRDFPVGEGYEVLVETLETTPNIVGIEKIFGEPVEPPPALPVEQVGFADLPLDADGFVRRTHLGTLPALDTHDPDRFRFSFALQLAEAYLAEEDLFLENGLKDDQAIRFGDTEFSRFRPNSGGYVNADSAGVQILIAPRSGTSPFEMVSMTDVIEGRVGAEQIRDRVVLIGITALSVKDVVNSAALDTNNPGLVYGVKMHAHITSQILSSVLDDRPILRTWHDGWEYFWIIFWGGAGIVLVRIVSRPAWYALLVGLVGLGLVGLSLALLWSGGWWIPVIPTLIVFAVNGLLLPGFYLYDQTLRSRIEERQRVIESTYDTIHNGPLQTLALLLQQREQLDPSVSSKLDNLNQELRAIYTRLLEQSLPQQEQLQLGNQRVIDLRSPLKEVLYEVYAETITRDFPGFDSIKFQITKFEHLQADSLSSDEKRSLCRFLEEALCNVGKHANSPKRLTVICTATETENLIRVEDNGKNDPPFDNSLGGRGTQQAQALAKRLRGQFQRSICETGSSCELRWPIKKAG